MKRFVLSAMGVCFGVGLGLTAPAQASTMSITIDGTDAIFLAGRTDLTIPSADQPWGDDDPSTDDGLQRTTTPTSEEALETVPPFITVTGGDIVRFLDQQQGGINFTNGTGPLFGTEGFGSGTSNLSSLGGISGYMGANGALTGVFLSDSIPSLANGAAPSALDYSGGLDFASIAPDIGQVFYIGDGSTSGGAFQDFIAPTGATRLFLGVPDGFSSSRVPGAYDDNDGSYQIRVAVNDIPTALVPLPAGMVLIVTALGLLGLARRKTS